MSTKSIYACLVNEILTSLHCNVAYRECVILLVFFSFRRAMHVQEPMTNGLPQDSLSKAIEAASKVNAILIASGKLKPAHAASENTQRVVTSESLSNKVTVTKKLTEFVSFTPISYDIGG